MKDDLKKLTKLVAEQGLKTEAIKTEVETWYLFARESRAKVAQHQFYFGEIDKVLQRQRNETAKSALANKETKEHLEVMGRNFAEFKGDLSGVKALADGIAVSGSLTAADLRSNGLDGAAEQMLRESVKDRVGFKLEL